MAHITPTETTYWCVYDTGLDILHTGHTDPGHTTSTIAGPIEADEAAITRMEACKEKLIEPTEGDTTAPYPDFFLFNNRVILLRHEDCMGKTTLWEAVRDREEETR